MKTMITMIKEQKKIKAHHGNQVNHSSDNWKVATRNPVEALRYE